jgi:membrane-associated phospholipid phosphatase
MGESIQRGFWARRLARDEWLGLHLSLGLLTCLGLLVCFSFLAIEANGQPTPGVDQRIYEQLREHRESSPATRTLFLRLTHVGTGWYIVAVVLLGATVLVLRRCYVAALVLIVAIAIAPLVNTGVKDVFKRDRPTGIDPLAPEDSYSFPSGHSMESMIAYGMLGYVLVLTLPRRWQRRSAVGGLAGVIVAVGFSRMYLSDHWFTDVLGGFTLGAAWAAFWIALLECGRRRAAAARRA